MGKPDVEDAQLYRSWRDQFTNHGIRNRPYTPGPPMRREVILCSGKPTVEPAQMFQDLARRIARGSNVVFLTTDTYARGNASQCRHIDREQLEPGLFTGGKGVMTEGGLTDSSQVSRCP